MQDPLYLPVSDEKEIVTLAEELPLAVDRQHFKSFVLGFPRKYLVSTPRMEIVKHYLLMEGLQGRPVISSISSEGNLWRMILVTRDRRALFSRSAGTLSCFGMNIVSAEAFANANLLVLDTFLVRDPEKHFAQEKQRRDFQQFLEDILESKIELEPVLRKRWPQVDVEEDEQFEVELDNAAHPSATRLTLRGRDHFGLLYLVSRCIAQMGCNIEIASIETVGDRVHDQFYLTREGSKLDQEWQLQLQQRLARLGSEFRRVKAELFGSPALEERPAGRELSQG